MKVIIISLALLSSFSVFASDCRQLAGTYGCNYEGETVLLKIMPKPKIKSIFIDIGGEKQEFIVNNEIQDSKNDDSQYISFCDKRRFVVDNYFQGKVSSVEIQGDANGQLTYSLNKGEYRLSLSCKKIK